MADAKTYSFDSVIDTDQGQTRMYDAIARENVQAVLDGANSTIFAYG